MIEVSDLAKRFGKVQAVDGASFTAPDGAITTLLGANGSGKTTTLNMLMGLLKPDRGAARIDGIAVEGNAQETRRRTGWFPDSVGLYPRLTSREHMRYFGELHGMAGKALEEAISTTIAALRMEDIADRRTEGFSTGQRMKVALARALVHSPRNIILDEPTRGLDVISVRLLRETLRQLRGEGRCILMSSHVMAEVQELSDHIVCIAGGRVVAEGSPQALMAQANAPDLEEAFIRLAVEA
ncbi:MAG TPA: ATP-binding cassette domain-containing protein [Allosphingosinicella sp.]